MAQNVLGNAYMYGHGVPQDCATAQDWLRRADKFEKDDPALVRKFFPGFNPATMNRQHDAYYDVQASIAEMNYYRKYLFKRPPQG